MNKSKECCYKKSFIMAVWYFVAVLFVALVIGVVGIILKAIHIFHYEDAGYVASAIAAVSVLWAFVRCCGSSKHCHPDHNKNSSCDKKE